MSLGVSGSQQSVTVPVQTSASLSVSIAEGPGLRTIGQPVAVTMTVTNSGGTDALTVTPGLLTAVGTGGLLYESGAVPGTATVAKGGGTATFYWTYSAVGAGTVALQGGATGTDANSGAGLTAVGVTGPSVVIQSPASLSIQPLQGVPSLVGTGNQFQVLMTVNNSGDATAVGVSVSTLAVTDQALVSETASTVGAVPGVVNIVGGGSQVFTYTYHAANVTYSAAVSFSGTVTGLDGNTGVTVTAGGGAPSGTVTVFPQANLTLQSLAFVPGGPLTVGQPFMVTATVKNGGQGTAVSVTVGTLVPFGGGTATLESGPSGNVSIASGSSWP
ncbi:MAG: hypothetical protein B7Z74_04850, partial [Deltaproteobacteria bacterium 21-66-5]